MGNISHLKRFCQQKTDKITITAQHIERCIEELVQVICVSNEYEIKNTQTEWLQKAKSYLSQFKVFKTSFLGLLERPSKAPMNPFTVLTGVQRCGDLTFPVDQDHHNNRDNLLLNSTPAVKKQIFTSPEDSSSGNLFFKIYTRLIDLFKVLFSDKQLSRYLNHSMSLFIIKRFNILKSRDN